MTTLDTRQGTNAIRTRWGSTRLNSRVRPSMRFDFSTARELFERVSHSEAYSRLAFPALIVLAALLMLIPTGMLGENLKKDVEAESLALARSIDALRESKALPELEVQREHLRLYQKDAEQIEQLVQQTTLRALLDYRIFPEPASSSIFLYEQFGRSYCSGMEAMLADLNAGSPPSEIEIEAALRQTPGVPRPANSPPLRFGGMERSVVDAVCRGRAESISVYAHPRNLAGCAFWKDYQYAGMQEAVEDCWYWQLGYWIAEDVLTTIAQLNTGCENVLEAPVKRLLRLSFDHNRGGRGKIDADQRPCYVTSPQDGLTVPLTGRFCDDETDAVHFQIELVIANDAVLAFMKELCSAKEHSFRGFDGTEQEQVYQHNQITILESRVEPVERGCPAHRLYRYGKDAVAKLRLICEYVFDSRAYATIKPESVKEALTQA